MCDPMEEKNIRDLNTRKISKTYYYLNTLAREELALHRFLTGSQFIFMLY